MKKGLVLVLSAPSGCGKDTVASKLCEIRNDCYVSVSATTRSPRNEEVDGVNYHFLSKDDFKNKIKHNQFLEYAIYNGEYYGTPLSEINKAVKNGHVCILVIEVNGAQKVFSKLDDCISVFLLPPSMEELKNRLTNRATESSDIINKRMEIAEWEMNFSNLYQHKVINNELDKAVEEINEIINKSLEERN